MQIKRTILWTIVALFGSGCARAQSLQHITYVGGTAMQGTQLHGRLSVDSTSALVFEGASKLSIPYGSVISYESTSRKVVHVGLLTEGIWRLVAPWPEDKQLSLSYTDADRHAQVVVFQMSRGDEAVLVEVLKTRVSRMHAGQIPLIPRTARVEPGKVAEHLGSVVSSDAMGTAHLP
jgi:hypothetical protein